MTAAVPPLPVNHPLTLLFTEPRAEIEARLVEFLPNPIIEPLFGAKSGGDRAMVYCFVDPPRAISSHHMVFCELNEDAISTGLRISSGYRKYDGHRSGFIDATGFAEASTFGSLLGAAAVHWMPGNITTGFAYFHESIMNFSKGGVFPILPTTQFLQTDEHHISTSGLSWFCGQEVELNHDGMSAGEGIRRVIRMANDMITNGPIHKAMVVPDIVEGKFLSIVPSNDGQVLKLAFLPSCEDCNPCNV